MGNIFGNNKLLDENNEEHVIFTEYFYKGSKYYITKDKLVFKQEQNKYIKVSSEISNEILKEIISYKEPDVIEFNDDGER